MDEKGEGSREDGFRWCDAGIGRSVRGQLPIEVQDFNLVIVIQGNLDGIQYQAGFGNGFTDGGETDTGPLPAVLVVHLGH